LASYQRKCKGIELDAYILSYDWPIVSSLFFYYFDILVNHSKIKYWASRQRHDQWPANSWSNKFLSLYTFIWSGSRINVLARSMSLCVCGLWARRRVTKWLTLRSPLRGRWATLTSWLTHKHFQVVILWAVRYACVTLNDVSTHTFCSFSFWAWTQSLCDTNRSAFIFSFYILSGPGEWRGVSGPGP
jgi:hypothetical protein